MTSSCCHALRRIPRVEGGPKVGGGGGEKGGKGKERKGVAR